MVTSTNLYKGFIMLFVLNFTDSTGAEVYAETNFHQNSCTIERVTINGERVFPVWKISHDNWCAIEDRAAVERYLWSKHGTAASHAGKTKAAFNKYYSDLLSKVTLDDSGEMAVK